MMRRNDETSPPQGVGMTSLRLSRSLGRRRSCRGICSRIQQSQPSRRLAPGSTSAPITEVFGLPLVPLTMRQVVRVMELRIKDGRPGFVITANLNTAMICRENPALARAIDEAALVVADGMPLVWASKLNRRPLPERVTGSDLVPALCERAAMAGYSVYILGGAPGVAEAAAANLTARFPGLNVVGIDAPPFRDLTPEETVALIDRVHAARPDILFMASSQPKGEIWLREHYVALNVPAQIQIGAGIDFAAGRVVRAPKWVGRLGLEWAFRLWVEPTRLARRYWRNTRFLLTETVRGLAVRSGGRRRRTPSREGSR